MKASTAENIIFSSKMSLLILNICRAGVGHIYHVPELIQIAN